MITLSQTIALTFTTGVFFTLYFISACSANRWLFFADEGWKRRERVNWLMAIVTNVIAALILASTVLSVRVPMIEMNFVEDGHKAEEWSDPAYDAIAKCMIANTVALLADTVLMYRLWVTHARKMWVMWFPIFLWLGGIVCTILQLFLQIVHIHNPNFGPYQWATVNMAVGPGIALTPFWASTIMLNAYCTGILIWRIWGASKDSSRTSFTKQLQFLVRILTESGALYLTISLAHFFVWFGKHNFGIYVLAEMNICVIGIAFNLVLIRIAQNRAEDEELGDNDEKLTAMKFGSMPTISIQTQSRVETSSAPTLYPHLDSRGLRHASSKSSQDTSTIDL